MMQTPNKKQKLFAKTPESETLASLSNVTIKNAAAATRGLEVVGSSFDTIKFTAAVIRRLLTDAPGCVDFDLEAVSMKQAYSLLCSAEDVEGSDYDQETLVAAIKLVIQDEDEVPEHINVVLEGMET